MWKRVRCPQMKIESVCVCVCLRGGRLCTEVGDMVWQRKDRKPKNIEYCLLVVVEHPSLS